MLEMRGVSYYFKNNQVLKDLDLDIKTGEIVCLLGPNGCGKTTLLNCITSYYNDYEGSIKFEHKHLKRMGYRQRGQKIAYIPQMTEGSFPYSVFDSILMGRTPYIGMLGSPSKEDQRIVHEVIERLEIGQLKDRRFNELSGGETQLVKIARGLAQQAKIQVMDEPTGALDLHNELQILETIASVIKANDHTVIMATHYPNQPLYFEKKGLNVRVCLMKDGRIRYQGKPSDVITKETMKDIYSISAHVLDYEEESGGAGRCVIPLTQLKVGG